MNWAVVISIILSTTFITFFAQIFAYKINRQSGDRPLYGFTLLFFLFFTNLEKLIINALGKKFKNLTPFFAYFILYIITTSLTVSLIGPPLATPFQYPLIIVIYGVITTLGIIFFQVSSQGFVSLLTYLNPLNLISLISSFISITFRLFGNLFAGFLVMGLIYKTTGDLAFLSTSFLQYFNLLGLLFVPFHLYFDVISLFLHVTIFFLLTLTYWSMANTKSSAGKN